MTSVRLKSWAKVNLTLDILGVRDDGYHELDSVVQVVSLHDDLEFSTAPDGVTEIISNVDWLPLDNRNTIYRAAEAFRKATGANAGFRCSVDKRIPAEAGLGGGSSNAAVTIAALDALYGTGLSTQAKTALAAEVGSDAPLFVLGGTVRMRGRGEVVEPLPDAPCLGMVIVKPDEGVSTPEAYRLFDNVRHHRMYSTDTVTNAIAALNADAVVNGLRNDFDPVISCRLESVRQARRALIDAGAMQAILSGSGSAVFGVYAGGAEASRAAKRLPASLGSVFVVRSMTRRESSLSEVTDGGC